MPNELLKNQAPYISSGYLMDEPQAVEVTLCNDPAVAGAKFRVIRSAGSPDKPNGIKLQMPVRKKEPMKQQVMGYVSIPWLEDWYGDVMDPQSIEHAANSFLKNLQQGNVQGNGIGEEHEAFWNNAHVIQSVVDYNGKIGGIPGGWWIAIQVTDPTAWQKVLDGQYTGFSLGSYVRFVNTQNEKFKEDLFQKVPNLKNHNSAKPTKGKPGMFENPGEYGFPTEQSAYADPANNKFPIDTRSRAYATLRYVLDNYASEGYSIEELKYVVRRMLAAIVTHGDEVPGDVMERVGFATKQSAVDHAGEFGMKIQNTATTSVEEEFNMGTKLSPELLEALQAIAQDTITPALKEQNDKINAMLASLKVQNTPESQPETKPAEEPKQQSTEDTQKTTEEPKNQVADIKAIVLEVLKEQATAQQKTAEKTIPVEEPKTQSTQDTDIKTVVAEFGKIMAAELQKSQQSTAEAIQALSDRINEMPIPRATVMKTMSKEDRTNHLEQIRRKIEGGFDITAEEGALAESLGVDFSADDPFAGLKA